MKLADGTRPGSFWMIIVLGSFGLCFHRTE
jgi:hypothetical protein